MTSNSMIGLSAVCVAVLGACVSNGPSPDGDKNGDEMCGVPCELPCPHPGVYLTDENGCDTCTCANPEDICMTNDDCGVGAYCAAPEGASCGAPGVCTDIPLLETCALQQVTYCACDGTTKVSPNACIYDRIAHEGECEMIPGDDDPMDPGDDDPMDPGDDDPMDPGDDDPMDPGDDDPMDPGFDPLPVCESNDDCAANEYCDVPGNACGGLGLCEHRPDFCTDALEPVCGCDGNTYDNRCVAAAHGEGTAHEGACEEPEPRACGGFTGQRCADDEYCHLHEGLSCGAPATGTCEPDPSFPCPPGGVLVCTCDGQTMFDCEATRAEKIVAHVGECEL